MNHMAMYTLLSLHILSDEATVERFWYHVQLGAGLRPGRIWARAQFGPDLNPLDPGAVWGLNRIRNHTVGSAMRGPPNNHNSGLLFVCLIDLVSNALESISARAHHLWEEGSGNSMVGRSVANTAS